MKEQITNKAVEVMDKIQDPLTEALLSIINSVGNAKDFVLAEIPDVIQQLLMWHFCRSLIWFLLGVSMCVGMIVITKKCIKHWDGIIEEMDDAVILPIIFVYAPLVITSILVTALNTTWLQIWIAPKVYLIEYAANLVR